MAIAKTKLDPGVNELVKAAIADLETSEGRSAVQEALRKDFTGAKPAEVVQRSLADLREVSTILDAKAPGDASAFKAWLSGISQKVAEASAEGGFLGIGKSAMLKRLPLPISGKPWAQLNSYRNDIFLG
jgi:hypothetical protein